MGSGGRDYPQAVRQHRFFLSPPSSPVRPWRRSSASRSGRPWSARASRFVYWGLDALTWRRARDRRDLALGLAVSGMVLRLLVVIAGLLVIGILDRPSFATAALSFLVAFTLYVAIRPMTYPPATPPAGRARLQ